MCTLTGNTAVSKINVCVYEGPGRGTEIKVYCVFRKDQVMAQRVCCVFRKDQVMAQRVYKCVVCSGRTRSWHRECISVLCVQEKPGRGTERV